MINKTQRKPKWLKITLPSGEKYKEVKKTLEQHNLHTICTSGKCPNLGECWSAGTATFMILGDICTRSCKFCSVKTGKPEPLDLYEPEKIARSVKLLKLKHCVITSVDRDDLEDGGASLWAETIREVKKQNPQTTIETLIPDFNAKEELIKKVIDEKPEIISHNLETVKRLTPQIRSRAKYDISLKVLSVISRSGIAAKSGIMVGLGESPDEVFETMDDILQTGAKIMTIGQYLQPGPEQLSVVDYITPQQFEEYKKTGLKKGFRFVESAPKVRSSYHAERHL